MLRELRIRNLALFEDAELAFGPGLNAITGATGAGKSLVLGALQLLLGGRFSRDLLRTGADSLEIEGRFELTDDLAAEIADALGIEEIADDREIIVRRRVEGSGRNRCSIHGRMSPVSGLRELGERLVEVHGQSEHQRLAEPAAQLLWFDRWAGLDEAREAFAAELAEWRRLAELRDRQNERADERNARIAALTDLVETVAGAELCVGEQDALRNERTLLAEAERHGRALGEARARLEGDEHTDAPGALDLLGSASRTLEPTAQLSPAAAGAVEALETAFARAADALAEIEQAADSLEVDPERLETVQDRLERIDDVLRRFGPTEQEALERAGAAADELAELSGDAADPERLAARLAEAARVALETGRALNARRRAAAGGFADAVITALASLGMEGARFAVEVDDGPDDGDLGSRASSLGLGSLRFVVSPNAGEDLRDLGRIASGGELARVALAVKGELADADRVPTLVFDEVDADVGPRLGAVIGRQLARLAVSRQVLVVTHLPQVAAHAGHHVRIAKSTEGARTVTRADALEGDDRLRELAEMLRGAGKAEAALDQARQLLQEAEDGA